MNRLREARSHGIPIVAAAMMLAAAFGFANVFGNAGSAFAQATQRSVQGRVVNANDVPIGGAIVYLSDTQTKTVESYITQKDGAYSFEQLSPNDNYKLWAKSDGKKSKSKVLSSFDDRSVFRVILKIDAGK